MSSRSLKIKKNLLASAVLFALAGGGAVAQNVYYDNGGGVPVTNDPNFTYDPTQQSVVLTDGALIPNTIEINASQASILIGGAANGGVAISADAPSVFTAPTGGTVTINNGDGNLDVSGSTTTGGLSSSGNTTLGTVGATTNTLGNAATVSNTITGGSNLIQSGTNNVTVDTTGVTLNGTGGSGVVVNGTGTVAIKSSGAAATASVLVDSLDGQTRGLSVGATTTTLSGGAGVTGGTSGTTLTMDDNGLVVQDAANGNTFTVNSTAGARIGNDGQAGSLLISNSTAGGNFVDLNGTTNTITGTTSTTINGGTSSATLSNTGVAIVGDTSITGTLSNTGNATIATGADTTNTFGSGARSVNTIGNAGTSTNTIRGATNTITGTTSTTITGGSTTMTLTNAGVDMGGKKITNLADGVNPTDAVTLQQINGLVASSPAITNLNSRVDNLNNRVDLLERRAYAGIASVSALSAIPAPQQGKRVSLGIGVGNYRNQSAIAAGIRAALSESAMVTFGVANTNEGGTVTNAGFGISW